MTGSSRSRRFTGPCYSRDPNTSSARPPAGHGAGMRSCRRERLQRTVRTGDSHAVGRRAPRSIAHSVRHTHSVGLAFGASDSYSPSDSEGNAKANGADHLHEAPRRLRTANCPRRLSGLPDEQPLEPEHRECTGQPDVGNVHRLDQLHETLPAPRLRVEPHLRHPLHDRSGVAEVRADHVQPIWKREQSGPVPHSAERPGGIGQRPPRARP